MVWTDAKAKKITHKEVLEWVDRFLGVYDNPTPTQIAIKGIAVDVIENWIRTHEE